MDILKKSNELMNRQLNDMREKVTELRESNDRLSGELTELATRPDEVKLEIITDVNARFSGMAQAQDEFTTQVNAKVEESNAATEADLEAKLAELTEVLEKHQEFVHFVATQQDSINRVFANRFDSRPWYQSVIGRWNDMELTRQETP
jgi:adenylosuccinate lyase